MNKTKNKINVIYPYKTKYGIWCFDDEDLGIVAEPFVGEINTMIDHYVRENTNIIVYISSLPIPNSTLILNKREDLGEGWYQLSGTEMTGWLCSCTLNYFPDYPKTIYVKIQIPSK